MLPRFRLDWRDPGVRRVLTAMGPALLGVSAAQISTLINTQLAAYLGDGRISWITYADRLMEFPSALLGVALGTILLPSLAKHYHDDNDGQYRALLDWGLRLVFLLALPATLALASARRAPHRHALRIRPLHRHRRRGRRAPRCSDTAWACVGLISVKILAPGFYARHDMRTPVRSAFLALLVAQTLAVTLMFQIGHAGLTLATSIGALSTRCCCTGRCAAPTSTRRCRVGDLFCAGCWWRLSCWGGAVVGRGRRRILDQRRAMVEGGTPRPGDRRRRAHLLRYALAARLSRRRLQPPRAVLSDAGRARPASAARRPVLRYGQLA